MHRLAFISTNPKLEKSSLQKRVVKWILFYANISYTESLIKLNLLPLNFYLQLNDLLVLARICLGKYETTLSSIFHFTQRRGQWPNYPRLQMNNSDIHSSIVSQHWLTKSCLALIYSCRTPRRNFSNCSGHSLTEISTNYFHVPGLFVTA